MKSLQKQFKGLVFKILILFLLPQFTTLKTVFAQEKPETLQILALYDSAITSYMQNDYEKSKIYFEQILTKKIKTKTDIPPEYFKTYNWLGLINKNQGYLEEAIKNYNLALNHTSDNYYTTLINENIANVYSLKGDYFKAIYYFENSLSVLEKSNNNERLQKIVNNYHNQAYTYYKSGQLDLALPKSLKSIQIAIENNIKIDGENYINCGLIYQGLDSLKKADLYFKKAIETYQNEFGENHHMTAMAYINHAVFYTETNNYNKSEILLNKSYDILIKSLGFKHYYTFLCLKNKGDLYLKKQDYTKALQLYQQALTAKIQAFDDTALYSNPAKTIFPDLDLLDVLNAKAKALEKLAGQENKVQNLMAALKTLELNVNYIEQLRMGYLYENSKLQLAAKEHDTYISIVSIAYSLFEITGDKQYAEIAFKHAELSKYAILRELENEEVAKQIASIPDSLQEKEYKLKEQISFLSIQLENENKLQKPSIEKNERYNTQLFGLSKELDALKQKLDADYPLYFQQKYKTQVVSSKCVQKELASKDAILEYVLTDSALFTFVLTKKQFIFNKQSIDSIFQNRLNFYTEALYSDYISNYYKYRDAAYYLYQKLIQPHENSVQNKNLVIIPDNNLLQISFDALVCEPLDKTKKPDSRKESYLIKKYALSYAYTATLYQNSLKGTSNLFQKFLGIAPGYENSKDSLIHLPLGIRNVKKLALLTFGRSYTDNKATKEIFKKHAGDYDIIHFFAHGLEDTVNPANSKLYLAPSNANDNGYLYAWEINNLQLKADLVVLAACYSGTGKLSKGEGLLSIARSFMYAGSKSIITSLWVASYKPVNSILNDFYTNSFKGMSKPEALQLAKLKFLQETNSYTAHPKFWSGIVLYGDTQPLYRVWYLKRIIGILILIFTAIIIIKRKKLFKFF